MAKPQQQIDIYAPLPFKSKLLSSSKSATFSSSAPFTPSYVISSLSLSSDPTALYASRVKGRQMLLENPARESRAKKEAERKAQLRKREKERRQLGVTGRRKREERGLWAFDTGSIKFAALLPLHHLWLGYMSELLALPQPPSSPGTTTAASLTSLAPPSSSMHPKLLKADFHGALLTVLKSKNPSLVGLSGIVIHETENAFRVITQKDQAKLLPKQNTIFTLAVPLFSSLPATYRPGMPYQLPLTFQAAPSPAADQVPGSDQPGKGVAELSLPSPSPSFTPSARETVLAAPHLAFELYGNQFRFRSAERAGRKFKHKETIEL